MLSKLRCFLVCITVLCAATCHAATLNVGPGQPYATIQSAINAANNGDTVLVAPGTYYEHINFLGKAITVTSSGGAANTLIDGSTNPGSTVAFGTNEARSSVLDGFTIDHATSQYSTNCYPYCAGAGIEVVDSSPTLQNLIVTNNECLGVEVNFGGPLLQNSVVSNTGSYLQGAGCSAYFPTGTGVYVQGINSGPQVIIRFNTITGNGAYDADLVGFPTGGGIVEETGNVLVENNIVSFNTAGNNKGTGVAAGSCWEGAGVSVLAGDAVIAQNVIVNNGSSCAGAGVLFDEDGAVPFHIQIVSNTIADNFVFPYSGLYGQDGTQVWFTGVAVITLANNVIEGGGGSPAVLGCSNYQSSITLDSDHNDLYNPQNPGIANTCTATSGTGNISVDPKFTQPSAGVYTLSRGSPAIDAGNNALAPILATDLSGNPRIQDATGAGCVIDMGAYEYTGTTLDCGTSEILQSSLNPSVYGQSVTFTAQLGSALGTPTGTVQFNDGGTALAVQPISSGGASTYTTSSLAVGTHAMTAVYQPTGTFPAATASLSQVVTNYPTTTMLTCSPSALIAYNNATVSIGVSSSYGTPTGTITITNNGAPFAQLTLVNGVASTVFYGLTVGSYTLTATYVATGAFAGSSASCTETVSGLPTTSVLTVSPANAAYGSPVTLLAVVSPVTLPGPNAPTGILTFLNGGTVLGSAGLVGNVNTHTGGTSLTLSSLPVGTDNLTCTYAGNTVFAASSCNVVPISISAAASALSIASSSNPAVALSPVTFSVHLSVNGQSAGAGNAIGLSVNGQTIALTTDANGNATYTTSSLTPGSYPVAATFAATANLLASNAGLTQVVTPIPTATTLVAAPNPAYQGTVVTLTATVAGAVTPVGSVTFFDGGTAIGTGTLYASGQATLTTSSLAVGTHPLTASYGVTTSYTTSTSPVVNEVILPSSFTISLSPSSINLPPGQQGTVAIHLASVGNFSGPLALTYGPLPQYGTAAIAPQSVNMTAGGTGSATLTLNTLQIVSAERRPGAGWGVVAAGILLMPLVRRRRRIVAILCAAMLLQAATGCTNNWFVDHFVAAGTYQLPITATDGNGEAQSATLTVVVQ